VECSKSARFFAIDRWDGSKFFRTWVDVVFT
jgi:hypothetical protein